MESSDGISVEFLDTTPHDDDECRFDAELEHEGQKIKIPVRIKGRIHAGAYAEEGVKNFETGNGEPPSMHKLLVQCFGIVDMEPCKCL